MKKLIEIYSTNCNLEEKSRNENEPVKAEITFQVADVINANNRRYSRSVLEKAINKVNEKISSGQTVWGCGFHPSDGEGRVSDVSHKIERLWMEKSGTCKGLISILPTSVGKDAEVLARTGKVGISSRGSGTTTKKVEKVDDKEIAFEEVNEDFDLMSIDFVLNPSVMGAGTDKIFEEVTKYYDEEKNELSEMELYHLMKTAGIVESYSEFLKKTKKSNV